jgi:hypothetical protein
MAWSVLADSGSMTPPWLPSGKRTRPSVAHADDLDKGEPTALDEGRPAWQMGEHQS